MFLLELMDKNIRKKIKLQKNHFLSDYECYSTLSLLCKYSRLGDNIKYIELIINDQNKGEKLATDDTQPQPYAGDDEEGSNTLMDNSSNYSNNQKPTKVFEASKPSKKKKISRQTELIGIGTILTLITLFFVVGTNLYFRDVH